MPVPQERFYTIDDIYTLPEGHRAELIDGVIYNMSAPSTQHQRIVHYLDRMIGNYIAGKRGTCEVFPAPFAVFLNKDEYNYLEPDLTIVCDPSKLNDKGCSGAPDWIVEIVSPSTKYMDYVRKMPKYQSAGVREYWVVDVARNRITVYNFDAKTNEEYTLSDVVPCGIYDGDLKVDFSDIRL